MDHLEVEAEVQLMVLPFSLHGKYNNVVEEAVVFIDVGRRCQ